MEGKKKYNGALSVDMPSLPQRECVCRGGGRGCRESDLGAGGDEL